MFICFLSKTVKVQVVSSLNFKRTRKNYKGQHCVEWNFGKCQSLGKSRENSVTHCDLAIFFFVQAKKLSAGKTIFHPIACQFCRPQCCDLGRGEGFWGCSSLCSSLAAGASSIAVFPSFRCVVQRLSLSVSEATEDGNGSLTLPSLTSHRGKGQHSVQD